MKSHVKSKQIYKTKTNMKTKTLLYSNEKNNDHHIDCHFILEKIENFKKSMYVKTKNERVKNTCLCVNILFNEEIDFIIRNKNQILNDYLNYSKKVDYISKPLFMWMKMKNSIIWKEFIKTLEETIFIMSVSNTPTKDEKLIIADKIAMYLYNYYIKL